MRLAPIIQRLRQTAPIFAGRVFGVAELSGIFSAIQPEYPCAFVVPLDDEPIRLRSRHLIEVEFREGFAVVAAFPMPDRQGLDAYEAAHDARTVLLRSLLGWHSDDGGDAIFYDGGEPLAMDPGRYLYQFNFGRETLLTAADDGAPIEGLETFTGAGLRADVVDPAADPNLSYPGPDGRIEIGGSAAPETE